MLEQFPDADISVSLVWIDMLSSDNVDAARPMAASLADRRVTHFHDPRPERHAGRAFGKDIMRFGSMAAWDVYLFYAPGLIWEADLPPPTEWFHQLGGRLRADPKRFAGGRLGEALGEATRRLTSASSAGP
jgi:hypothetical protein